MKRFSESGQRLNLFALLAALALAATAFGDPVIPDPHAWYVSEYGPVWAQASEHTAAASIVFYDDEILDYGADGVISRRQTSTWLGGAVAEWIEEGWLGSELPNVLTDRINDSTASFKARYLDIYKSGERSFSCGWYLAHHAEDGWKFTAFAEIECDLLEWRLPTRSR